MKTFNPENGQIYTEITQSSARSMVFSAWKNRITGKILDPRAARHVKGAGSLQDMAMRVCCWHINLFMPEALAHPGWEHASKIYRKLKSRDALSFEAWMLFQEAYPHQSELSHHFRLEMHDVVTCWSSIIRSLNNLDTSVLTHFCANGLNLDIAKLISLTEIPTLAALIHSNSSQRQTNPLRGNALRDWCRAVREKKAFPKLKLLYMTSIPDQGPFDNIVLHHLSSFPALVLVGIERSSPHARNSNSEEYGQWQRSSPTREHKLNTTMRDVRVSMAEKTGNLYKYACRISQPETEDGYGTPHVTPPHASTYTHSQLQSYVLSHPVQSQSKEVPYLQEADQPVLLTLSCYAPQNTRYNTGSATWFVRKHQNHYLSEQTYKRPLDTKDSQDGEEKGAKKGKIRQGRQYDVGSLLGLFDPPLVNSPGS